MPSSAVQTCALRSEEHTSELQSHDNLVCRLLLEKKHWQRPRPSHRGARACPPLRLAPTCARTLGGGAHVGAVSGRWAGSGARVRSFFFLMIRRPPRSTLFPYTRSSDLSGPSSARSATGRRPPTARSPGGSGWRPRSEEHTSELQSHDNIVCRLLLEKKKTTHPRSPPPHTSTWPPTLD